MTEGFVAFADRKFVPLLGVLIDSVLTFSDRPIIAYGVNIDLPWAPTPRLTTRRIDAQRTWFRGPPRVRDLWALKSRTILASGLRYGVYCDADAVVNKGVDTLFAASRDVGDYPLCPRHPQDPDNQAIEMRRLGVRCKSMPYVHGHLVFSERCRPFLEEWNSLCRRRAAAAPNADETLLNVLLWKHDATRHLPAYDPYFEQVERYLRGLPLEGYDADTVCHIFHGCKDHARAAAILARLRQHHNAAVATS